MVLYTPTYCIVKVDQVYMYVVVYGYAKLLPCNMTSYTNIVSYVHAFDYTAIYKHDKGCP